MMNKLQQLVIVLVIFAVTRSSYGAQNEAEAQVVLEVPAMGRMAQLGEFYDATDEKFLNQLIFSMKVPAEANLITTVDNPSTETKFQVIESFTQKITFLGIAASIAVSLKTGGFSIDVKGAASYVKDEKHSAKAVEGFLVHKTETSRDSVDLFYEGIRPYVDLPGLMETTATHVVTGIYNGADVAARFTDVNQLDEDRQDIKGRLEIAFSMQSIQVSGSAEVNITNGEFVNSSRYDLQISGDVPMKTIPRNNFEVYEFIKTIPSLLRDINNGKGKPIRYVLTPLQELKSVYEMEYMKAKIVAAVDEAILKDILVVFEDIGVTRQNLNDLQDLFDAYVDTCMTPSIKKALDNLSNNFDADSGQFTADIRNGLVAVRNSTNNTMDLLQVIINKYRASPYSPSSVNIQLENNFEDGKRKIQFYEAFMKHDVQYMTESTYEADLVKTDDHVFYVLFYNLTLVDKDIHFWEDNTYLFFNQLKKIWTKLKVVDCDFALQNAHCSSHSQTKIYSYISNRRVSSDVLTDFRQYERLKSIRIQATQIEKHEKLYDLGHMFDADQSTFIESSLMSRKNLPTAVHTPRAKNITCEIIAPTYEAMFAALSVPGRLQIPVLLGKESLKTGSGLVMDVRPNATMERLNLLCVATTTKEEFDVMRDELFYSIDLLSLVDRAEASHFVQAREHILQAIVSLEMEKSAETSKLLRRNLEIIKSAIEVTLDDNQVFDEPIFDKIVVRMFTDLYNQEIHNVKEFKDIMKFLTEIKTAKADLYTTKGTPVYTFHPIPNIQIHYGLITRPRSSSASKAAVDMARFSGYFDALVPLTHEVNVKQASFKNYETCTPSNEAEQIRNLPSNLSTHLQDCESRLWTSYTGFQDTGSVRELEKSLSEFANVTGEGEFAHKTLNEIGLKLKETMTFYDMFNKTGRLKNQIYITSVDSFNGCVDESSVKPTYFLFFHLDWMKSFQMAWIENMAYFFRDFDENTSSRHVVDCSFIEAYPCSNVSKPVIQEYNNTFITCEDVVQRLKDTNKTEETAEDRLQKDLDEHIKTQNKRYTEMISTIEGMVTEMKNYEKEVKGAVSDLEEALKASAGSPPPVGATYVQYDKQAAPTELWGPNLMWATKDSVVTDYGKVMQRIK